MESTVPGELLVRLIASLVLAAVTGLAVVLLARVIMPPPRGTADYVVPHRYESNTDGDLIHGWIVDPGEAGRR